MMKDVNGFLDTLLKYKDRIDNGQVPKKNFENIRPLMAKEHFNVETMTKKSSAAADLTDFVINITVYWGERRQSGTPAPLPSAPERLARTPPQPSHPNGRRPSPWRRARV
jgi:hypothetical protein